jgi:hypothetical protein
MRSEYNQGENISISRPSSDAYLVIDSADRGSSSTIQPSGYTVPQSQPFNDFRLQKPQNLLQGGFTGLSLTEINFPYAIPNVIAGINDRFWIKLQNPVSGSGVGVVNLLAGGASEAYYTPITLANVVQNQLNGDATIGTASVNQITWSVGPNINNVAAAGFGIQASSTAISVPNMNFTIYPVNPALMTIGANGVPTATTVQIPNKSLMTLMGFDYVSNWSYWTQYFNQNYISRYAPMTYTTYIDICSDKLTQYQKVRDASSKTNSRGNIVCRLYIADETSTTPVLNEFYDGTIIQTINTRIPTGSVPFNIHRQFKCPKHFRWNKEVAIDWIDIKLYDDGGNPLYTPPGGLPDFQITFKASED